MKIFFKHYFTLSESIITLAYTYVIFHFQDQLFHANRLITDNAQAMSNLSSTLFLNDIKTFENVVYRNFRGLYEG